MKEWLKVSFKINIPANATRLIHLLQQNGYLAYLVGGCVRDSILGRIPHDWDICTSATPNEMIQVFKGFQIIETGLQHGTITVVLDGDTCEVTTFRIDGKYSNNRRPDSVVFTNELEEDLSRRDFTINAMAYNDEEGLIDPFEGVKDLRERLVRSVGDANTRFDEDALRVLRALRFSCQLGFAIEPATAAAVLGKSPLLANISKERINSELCKMVGTDNFSTVMVLYGGVFCQIIPEICDMICFDQHNPDHEHFLWRHTASALNHCDSDDLITRLTIFFHDFGKPYCYQLGAGGIKYFKGHGKAGAEIVDSIMTSLKFDNKTRHAVTELVYYHDAVLETDGPTIKRWLNKIGSEQFRRLLSVRRADIKGSKINYDKIRISEVDCIESKLDTILKNGECFSIKDLAINGDDLISIGFHANKALGNTLNRLLFLVIDGKILNNKADLLNAAINCT